MQQCKGAKTYQAEVPPRCAGGRGCEACRAKWEARQRARQRALTARKTRMAK